MPFIDEILDYKTISVAGLEKNSGKTECLNYIIKRISQKEINFAVTSIGLDGESVDAIYNTSKPEIYIKEGVLFGTAHVVYNQKRVVAEVLDVGKYPTPLGRVITSRSKSAGKIILSGYSNIEHLNEWKLMVMKKFNVNNILIDGALSRLSGASPKIADAVILATGASVSLSFHTLVSKTLYAIRLMMLNKSEYSIDKFKNLDRGWKYLDESNTKNTIFVNGALTDRLFKEISIDSNNNIKEIIVQDYTRIFISKETLDFFEKSGGKITLLNQNKLIAVCVNPLSPSGVVLDSIAICKEIYDKSGIPAYDIFKVGYAI